MKTHIITVISLFLVFGTLGAFSQEQPLQFPHFESDELSISSQLIDCVDEKNGTAKQYLSIQMKNISDAPIEVSFKKEMWYDGVCLNCSSSSSEYTISVPLASSKKLAGTCFENKDLLVFSKMLELKNVRKLTHFEFKNVVIKKL